MKTKEIVDYLYYQCTNSNIRIESFLLDLDSAGEINYSVSLENRVWSEILARQKKLENKRRSPYYLIGDEDRRILIPYSRFFPSDSTKDKNRKIRLLVRGKLLKILNEQIKYNETDFECICGYLCVEAGSKYVKVTSPGNDGGVDFFSIIPSHSRSTLFPSLSSSIRIVGQAKYWNSKTTRTMMGGFNDKLNEIRYEQTIPDTKIPSWFHTEGPIIGYYVNHKGFQSGAIAYAKSAGIILLDSYDIVERLSLDRTWDPKTDVEGLMENLESQLCRANIK